MVASLQSSLVDLSVSAAKHQSNDTLLAQMESDRLVMLDSLQSLSHAVGANNGITKEGMEAVLSGLAS